MIPDDLDMTEETRNRLEAFKNQLRRRLIYTTDKRRITEGLAHRRGSCVSCGRCCRAVFKCPFVYERDGKSLCRIHEHKPVMCELYPFAADDFFKHLKDGCGYHFVDPVEEKRRAEEERSA